MTTFLKFRKKPIVVEAIQYLGAITPDIEEFMEGSTWRFNPEAGIEIATLEGVMTASVTDWIIRGVTGEHYPCKVHIFEATYELCE